MLFSGIVRRNLASTTRTMPQATLSRTLKIDATSPAKPKKAAPKKAVKNASKLTPAVLKAKQSGGQGRFEGTVRTMEEDLRLLGLEPARFLGEALGKGGAAGVLGNRASREGGGGVSDAKRTEIDQKGRNRKVEKVAEDVARDDDALQKVDEGDASNKLLRGSGNAKNKTSSIAPTAEDVHPDDKDHVAASIATQHASDSHVLGKRKHQSEDGGIEDDPDVTGAKEGKGKKRVPSMKEGGAAGDEGVKREGEEGGRIPKRRKDAYEIRKFLPLQAYIPLTSPQDGKIAHKESAARVDADPPLDKLLRLQQEIWGNVAPSLNASPAKKRAGKDIARDVEKGESVVYWMRMEDMRGWSSHVSRLLVPGDSLTRPTSRR